MDDPLLVFNGIDATTGDYLLAPMTPKQAARFFGAHQPDPDHLRELRWWRRRAAEAFFGPREGVDPKSLTESGWGVIFAHDADPAIREAMAGLLEHRRREAGRAREQRYREFAGEDGYRPGETKQQFLARHGAGPGPADPDRVPYYLLIAGDPASIPFSFQYQLDVQYAVGRIHFDTPEGYAAYARSVVAAETGGVPRPRRAAIFAARNPGDQATSLSSAELATPLAESLRKEHSDWSVKALVGEQATKQGLADLLGGDRVPTLLFTATHGAGFPGGHPRQLRHQGALVCQDWPGPGPGHDALAEDHYFSGDDLDASACLLGLISFHFACFSAGTPRWEDFAPDDPDRRVELAPHPFVGSLPKRLLSHPGGGALGVVGHVERAWGYSFLWPQVGSQTEVYRSCLERLIDGHPLGSAFEYFNERYAELSCDLSVALEDTKFRKHPDYLSLSAMWTANNDARGFAILGDPAARLLTQTGAEAGARERIEIDRPAPAAPATGDALPAATAPGMAPAADIDFGLLEGVKSARDRLARALQNLAGRLATALESAVESVTVLEVATYVSDNPSAVSYDRSTGRFGDGAELRALSRVGIDGDTLVLAPEDFGEADERLWILHASMIQQARAARNDLLKTAGSAASALLDALKSL